MIALPEGPFRVLYADPPWSYQVNSPLISLAKDHYSTMSLEEICDLPVKDMMLPDSVCFMWVTAPLAEMAFEVLRAWKFKYKAQFIWAKNAHNMGHYNSVRHELLYIATKGSCLPDEKILFPSVQQYERGQHSEKPREFRDMIDKLYTWGKKIELFSRCHSQGWEVWGNQVDKLDKNQNCINFD